MQHKAIFLQKFFCAEIGSMIVGIKVYFGALVGGFASKFLHLLEEQAFVGGFALKFLHLLEEQALVGGFASKFLHLLQEQRGKVHAYS